MTKPLPAPQVIAALPDELRDTARRLMASGSITPKEYDNQGTPLFSAPFVLRVCRIECEERSRMEAGEIRTAALAPDVAPAPGYRRAARQLPKPGNRLAAFVRGVFRRNAR